MSADEAWEPPLWMEPYLPYLGGRNHVVDLMSGPRAKDSVNYPLANLQVWMLEEVMLLKRLYNAGLLSMQPPE